jgi:hypothetical protein
MRNVPPTDPLLKVILYNFVSDLKAHADAVVSSMRSSMVAARLTVRVIALLTRRTRVHAVPENNLLLIVRVIVIVGLINLCFIAAH